MFIKWIGQLTALLDKPESPAVHKILLDIAGLYLEVGEGCVLFVYQSVGSIMSHLTGSPQDLEKLEIPGTIFQSWKTHGI